MALNLTNPTGAHKGSCALAPLRCAHQRHHAGGPHVAEVAVEEPRPFLARVEGDGHRRMGGDDHRIAHRPGKAPSADAHHLEMMPVQVHRVHHGCGVREGHLRPLALAHVEGPVPAADVAVNNPARAGPFAEHHRIALVRLPWRDGLCRGSLQFEGEVGKLQGYRLRPPRYLSCVSTGRPCLLQANMEPS